MSHITLSKSVIEKITKDPKFRQLRESGPEGVVPVLFYSQRCYSTLNDGSIVEHGDGFGLNFVDPAELYVSDGNSYQPVSIGEGAHVLVHGPEELFSKSFEIDGSNNKFAFKPAVFA